MKVTLDETESEYLLRIPAFLKDRAKSIKGYRWDTEEKCWRYARTIRNYDALIQEFGDDLVAFNVSRPSSVQEQETSRSLHDEIKQLKAELANKDNLLESLTKVQEFSQTSIQSENQALKIALSSKQNEISIFQKRFENLEDERSKLKYQLEELYKDFERQRQDNTSSEFMLNIKALAKNAIGNDRGFCAFIDKLKIDNSLPIEIAKHLEKTLKKLLATTENNLYELITQAKDADILTDEATQLAHLIRRHRNITAHEQVDIRTKGARVLLILLSASLLWPLLPE